MCNYCNAPVSPKDETWWEDMDWDAQQYQAEQEEENE